MENGKRPTINDLQKLLPEECRATDEEIKARLGEAAKNLHEGKATIDDYILLNASGEKVGN